MADLAVGGMDMFEDGGVGIGSEMEAALQAKGYSVEYDAFQSGDDADGDEESYGSSSSSSDENVIAAVDRGSRGGRGAPVANTSSSAQSKSKSSSRSMLDNNRRAQV